MAGARDLEQRVLRFVEREQVLRRGEKLLLLLSGGADSMAMLAFVRLADQRLGLGLDLAALHVDYGLRGEESTRDRLLVERACAAVAVELEVVRLEGRLRGANFQSRARAARYERARALCTELDCDAIGVAHNRDDQAETILYRLTKYASPQALAGMQPRESYGTSALSCAATSTDGEERPLVRPLLCLGADEVRAYCAARHIAYGEDVSNSRPVYARNVLRLEVLPRLAAINPRVTETLAAGAELAVAQEEVLAAAVREAWRRVARPAGEGETALAVDALAAEPRALRLLCLRELVRVAHGPAALVERRIVESLERLAGRADDTGRVDLGGGWEVARGGGLLRLRRRRAPHACAPVEVGVAALQDAAGDSSRSWAVPALSVFCGRRYRCELVGGALLPPHETPAGTPLQAWVGLGEPPRRVVLRHPRRGDRFRPLGQSAATTVARFLGAAHVAAEERATALVLEIDGDLAWVGFPRGGQRFGRVAHPRRVSESTALTFHLEEEDRD